MIREVFGKTRKPLNKIVFQTMSDLGKHHARLELAYLKLDKRNKNLFNACTSCLNKGLKARATIYANEIAEIRKILAILQNTQLAVERAILRLETLNTVSPTLENLQGIFSDVKNALGLMANVMPSLTPEISKLNNAISEIMETSQFNLDSPEPIVIKDECTEAILKEAASFVEEELQKKIPVPPMEAPIPEPAKPTKPTKPLIALAAHGSEVYLVTGDSPIKDSNPSSISQEVPSSLSEELVMDYVERNHGQMNITKCAKELNMAPAKVLEALKSLSKKGKIKIE